MSFQASKPERIVTFRPVLGMVAGVAQAWSGQGRDLSHYSVRRLEPRRLSASRKTARWWPVMAAVATAERSEVCVEVCDHAG